MSAGGGLRIFRVHTQCTEPNQLADKLAAYCGDDSLALPAARGLAVGVVTRFCVTLASGAAVLAGRGQVVWVKDNAAEASSAWVRIKVLEFDEACRAFFEELLQRRRPAPRVANLLPAPSGRPPPSLPPLEPGDNVFAAFVRETSFREDEVLQTSPPGSLDRAGGCGSGCGPSVGPCAHGCKFTPRHGQDASLLA